ncbi:MAG: class I SAM-dependent methyltransferase [Rhizobiaceae bacterium]|nr:class I SAM-dependent methyltransferase [Rhizobiaceae bacterium]
MPNYLETHYSRDEYAETAFPQKLCDHLIEICIKPHYPDYQGKSLLDVGSGKGNHLVALGRRGLDVYGLDKRPESIEVLKDFDIRQSDLEAEPFPFDDNSLDIVFSKSVIEHVWNADNFLEQTLRVLKPGGLAVLLTPDWRTQAHMFWDDYTHVKPWTRKGLQNALKLHGFEQVDSRLFRQLSVLWKYPAMEVLADLTSFAPESWKWKDREERQFNEWIRFSKEKMLLATAVKPK